MLDAEMSSEVFVALEARRAVSVEALVGLAVFAGARGRDLKEDETKAKNERQMSEKMGSREHTCQGTRQRQ